MVRIAVSSLFRRHLCSRLKNNSLKTYENLRFLSVIPKVELDTERAWQSNRESRVWWDATPWAAVAVIGAFGWTVQPISYSEEAPAGSCPAPEAGDPEAPISNESTAKWRIFTDKGREHVMNGRYEEAEKYLRRALLEAKAGFGEREAHVASALNNLAEYHRVRKQYSEAEPLYLEGLGILEEQLGRSHPSTAMGMHNLAGFYLVQKNYAKAQEYYEMALEVKERALGASHPDYAASLFHLAEVLVMRDRSEDAAALMKQSLQLTEAAGLSETTSGVRQWARLSQVLSDLKQYEEAEGIQRRILQMVENSRGAQSEAVASVLENLADTLERQRKWSEARDALSRALQIRRSRSGAEQTPAVGRVYRRLGWVGVRKSAYLSHPEKPPCSDASQHAELAAKIADRELASRLRAVKLARQNEVSAPPGSTTAVMRSAMEVLHVARLALAIPDQDKTLKEVEGRVREARDLLEDKDVLNCVHNSATLLRKEFSNCIRQLADELQRKIMSLDSQSGQEQYVQIFKNYKQNFREYAEKFENFM